MQLQESQQILNLLQEQAQKCRQCPLNQVPYNPGNVVFGIGNLNPKVLLIGEAPGEQESISGKPFIGRSGKKLRSLLMQAGFELSDLYITNVIKHRPPDNRKPTDQERHTCVHFLVSQIETIQPLYILCIGKTASITMAELAGIKLPSKNVRQTDFKYKDISVFNTWHPSYVLRNPSAEKELLQDLLKVYTLVDNTTNNTNH